jgi:hypothetical protein
LESCSVYQHADVRANHGSTKAKTDGTPPTLPSIGFILMSGPAAHMFIVQKEFEKTANRFFSDFAFVFRTFPRFLQRDTDKMIHTLRTFAETFCREWVLKNQPAIMRLALSVQENVISEGCHGLAGDTLENALLRAWGATKPSAVDLEIEILRSFTALWESRIELQVDALAWSKPWIGHLRTEFKIRPA